jgi:hypothetical protein
MAPGAPCEGASRQAPSPGAGRRCPLGGLVYVYVVAVQACRSSPDHRCSAVSLPDPFPPARHPRAMPACGASPSRSAPGGAQRCYDTSSSPTRRFGAVPLRRRSSGNALAPGPRTTPSPGAPPVMGVVWGGRREAGERKCFLWRAAGCLQATRLSAYPPRTILRP